MMKKICMVTMVMMLLTVGCGQSDTGSGEYAFRDDVAAQALVDHVAEDLGEDYWPNMELAPEYLDDWYGISEDMYVDYYGQTPMISVNVDTLIVVKASEGHLEDVQNAFATYQEAMVQDTMQYPANLPKIQSSRIETLGNYVCFVQLGGYMNDAEDEESMAKVCVEMNERALSLIRQDLTK